MSTKYSGMIIKVAWRNVWRSKVRSAVVVLAVALGLWAGIFTASFMYGVSTQRLQNIVSSQLSHIQVHYPEFTDDMDPTLMLADGRNILKQLSADERIKSASGRVLATGTAAAAWGSGNVVIKGVVPAEEKKVTNIHEKMVQGSFFNDSKQDQIVVGEKLAKKLKLKLKSQVTLRMQSLEGHIIDNACKVVGIFKTNSSRYDEANVFVHRDSLAKMMGAGNSLHEVAFLLHDPNLVDSTKAELQQQFPALSVESWKDLAPELDFINKFMDVYLFVFMGIILLAMAFGIINTMLMAVMERTREIGVLMAVGMNKIRIFSMIMLETIFLTLTGVPVGLLLSLATIRYFSKTGVDLSLFSEGLANFDVESIVYPSLDTSFYPVMMLMAAFTALLAAIYPAYKALKLHPSKAIRTV